ncbi:MAG TPA: hypothetical protein DEQ40_02070, partial [Oxalobacteraceae bacterium]|nr:hypothetical protein [Oxalobacteraceae bacterium]
MAQITLLDIAKANGHDAIVGLIEANQNTYPEFTLFPARTIKGTSYPTLKRLNYPTAAFRQANKGSAAGVSTYQRDLVECFILDQQLRMDTQVADASEDGAAAELAREASGGMMGVARTIASQIYYGTGADALGFGGFKATVDSTHVFSAGDTGANSSVWAVKFGDQDVKLIGGSGNGLAMAPEWRIQSVSDANSNPYDAYVNAIKGWIGLQLVNPNSIGQIKLLGTNTGKTMTDSLAYDLIATMPANWRPDAWLMNRRSATQLRKSRTTPTTAYIPTPLPPF